jgi:hypothetical protein
MSLRFWYFVAGKLQTPATVLPKYRTSYGKTPLTPLRSADRNSAKLFPFGETRPTPVITTRSNTSTTPIHKKFYAKGNFLKILLAKNYQKQIISNSVNFQSIEIDRIQIKLYRSR